VRFWDTSALLPLFVAEKQNPAGLELVTFDERLATAAEKEGFPVLGA